MKRKHRIINKLIYAILAAITIGSAYTVTDTSNSSTAPNHIVSAKSTKHRRWKNARATIYLDLGKNKDLIAEANDAIKAWNATGAFTFVKTKKRSKAKIVVIPWYNTKTDYSGYTTWNYNLKTKLMYNAVIQLNQYYLQNYANSETLTSDDCVNLIEHELGHAIGLNHVTNQDSVMNPTVKCSIQAIDIKNAKKIYHK